MSEINRWSYELQDFINKNNLNNITVNSCLEENNECELKLIINNNNNLKILTNFKSYCYVESSLYDTNELNQYILFSNKYKSLDKIINTILYFKFNNEHVIKKIKYSDKYHFYNELEEKTKLKLNFKELELIAKNNKSQNKILNIKIPNELLLNKNQIIQLITSEIKKINSNYDYKHTIEPIEKNIYSLKSTIYLENVNVEIKINLNNNLYPYYPPSIEIISPKVKLPLYFAIINLNITNINNWNPLLSLEWIIINLAEKLNLIIDSYIDNSLNNNPLENYLLKLSNITKENYHDKLSIDFVISNISKKNTKTDKTINNWKSGTGYGTSNTNTWNINQYIKEKEIVQSEIYELLKEINNILNEENLIFIKESCLLRYIINTISGINLLTIENDYLIFNEIIKILSNIKILPSFKNVIDSNFIEKIVKNLENINEEIMMLFQNNEELQNNELFQGLHNVYQIYAELITENNKIDNINDNISYHELYCNIMKPLQFGMYELLSTHTFFVKKSIKPEPNAMKRIISEISSFKTGLPLNYESSIWIRISKTNMNLFTFLISGPKDTPYENGLFLFDVFLPGNYPQVEPKVLLVTTGNGSVRFNPNLYNCGKVCLSLLGTWSGQESEKWNPKTSTFLQVLVSIQSLILIDQPFFNEPGYERTMNTPDGQNKSKSYNNNIQYENIRWGMIDNIINPPHGYEDVVRNHFKYKKNDIINVVEKWENESDSKLKSKMSNEISKLKDLLNNL
jgi:ubiquitin-protein ligase